MQDRRCWYCCRLSVREMVVGSHQVASALAAAHAQGIVHQDVRWDNVMHTLDQAAWKLVDFGCADVSHVDGKRNWSDTFR